MLPPAGTGADKPRHTNTPKTKGMNMLHKAKTLKGYKLDSLDGEMGKVKDFYFDDQHRSE
mgnify:FL=1